MATITGYTAARMQDIEDSAIVGGSIVGGELLLDRYDGGTVNAGQVQGPVGEVGPPADLGGMRFRGYGTVLPTTDLQIGDVYFKEA
jgi:hypothetical protein